MEWIKNHARILGLVSAGLVVGLVVLLAVTQAGALSVMIWEDGQTQPIQLRSSSRIPSQILQRAKLTLQAEDRVLVNGMRVDPDSAIISDGLVSMEVRRAHQVTLTMDGTTSTLVSSAPTLGDALWENNIILHDGDFLSVPLDTSIHADLAVTIRRGQPLRIQIGGQSIDLSSAAETVGQALAQAGVALQGLDYSQPAEGDVIPEERVIKIVRMREEIQLQPQPIAFTSEFIASDQLELDTQEIIQVGEYGLKMNRLRIRYEDDREVDRETEAELVVKAPVNQQLAYGTKINIKTLSTNAGTIEYWRAVSVWITSYHETGSRTASGAWPVKGDIAVNPTWYKTMKGLRIYVPGYGIGLVSDVCPGCVGKPWIDVFLPNSEYVGWHTTQVVYFLTPVPNNILWVLE
jgi:uncharacterized protein YabE (DUF348 family)